MKTVARSLHSLSRPARTLASAGLLFGFGVLAHAGPLQAQETDLPIPPGLASSELERSRACVPVLTRLATLERELEPLAERARRLGALNQAVGLEDRGRVDPLDPSDPMEAAVAEWFQRDEELAEQYAETADEATREERNRLRREIQGRLRETFEAVNEQAGTRLEEELDLGEMALGCDGAVLVRSAVVEACQGLDSAVCTEAREAGAPGRFRFVEAAEDLWDMEQLRPWSDPTPLLPSPEGGLGGGQTGTLLRRGNLTLVLSLETILQDRAQVDPEEAAEYDAHLEALGIPFDDARFVMTPALAVAFDTPGRLGGETHYLLHFGDLSDPPNQVFWSVPATGDGPLQALFPAPGWVLAQLADGAEVSLTAVQLPEGDPVEGEVMEADAVFTMELTSVGQPPAVGALLAYMVSGEMAEDLARLVPPDGPETPERR